ncbi:MAG TPA: hypothetical protein VGH28_32830 [Polyangiaceae bacterium]
MKRALALMLLATTHCYSYTTLSRAHTVGAGHVEAFAAPEALVVPASNQVAVRPVGEIGARIGVTDRVDLEGRVTTLGGSLAAHVQLRRDPSRFGVEAMLAPGAAFTAPDKLAFELPLVVGVNVGHDDQIVLAPRVVYQLRFDVPGLSRPLGYAFLGGSIGFAWRLVRHFTLMPEASFLGQIWSEPGFASNYAGTVGVQLALGALFDF